MLLIRVAEQEIADYYLKNKVMSFVHFYVGQEAVAVGVSMALENSDRTMGNHRSHGHYLAKGGDLKRIVSELLGKSTGSSKGKGGSMHAIDKSVNFIGSTPILGSVVPLATGSAFEQKFHNKKSITVAFYGDGASEEGQVYESYNLAALFKLPILFVIENNLYADSTRLSERRGENYSTQKIVEGIGLPYLKADGNNFDDVFEKAKKLVSGIRKGDGPAVLECSVYRHMAHSAPIFDESLRGEDTVEARKEKDSVKKLRNRLLEAKVSEKKVKEIEEEVKRKVSQAITFATNAPYPNVKSVSENIYAQ
ncbi:MAG: thiamine pyrophosphate-dependent dehydrogenase E1 component subunit alpha [bacterium]|nr:thiamine pyrophosphate-dependent dehydrogenase E1 component subunit alpha [bacterium]